MGHSTVIGDATRRSVAALIALLMVALILIPGADPAKANGPTPLSISVVPSSDTVSSGDWLTWTITVVNEEPDTHTVRITDQINGMRDLILTSSRGYCTESNLLVTCDGVRLPGHGATWVVTVRGLVTAPDGDTLFNTGTVVARNGGQDFSVQDTSSVLVSNQPTGPHPDLTVSIDAPLTANPNSPVTYTLTVNNSGAANANDINVTAHVPGGYLPTNTTETSLFDCDFSSPPAVVCTGGRVNAGSNAIITIQATTPPSPGSYMAKAVVDPYDAILENDDNNNTAEREMTVPSAPAPTEPFVVTKVGSPAGQVKVGDVLTYTINITNTSTKWRTERIKVTDGVTGLNAATISATSSHPKALCNLSAQTSVVYCNAANNNLVLTAGQSMTVTISGVVVAEPSTVLRNTVTVEAIQNKVALTRTSSVATTVRPKVDLTLTQQAVCDALPVAGATPTKNPWGSCPFRARDEFNYVITVGNSGLDDATDVRVRQPLPEDVVFEGFSATGGFNCITPAVGSLGGVVDCRNGSIAGEVTGANLGGTVQTIVLHLTAPNSTGPITATSTVDPANAIFEADETNNTATTTTPIRTGIDLTTQTRVNHPEVAPSGTLVYLVTMSNIGTQDSSAIKLTDIIPEGTRFRAAKEVPNPVGVDYTPLHGFSCKHDDASSGGDVTCTGGRLKGTYAINGGPAWKFPAIVDSATIEITLFAPAATGIDTYAFDLILNQALVDPDGTIHEIDEDPIATGTSSLINNLNLLVTDVQIPATPGTNGTFHELTVKNDQTFPSGANPSDFEVAPNGTLVYTLTVKNHGSDPAFNIEVWNTIPEGSRFRAANSSPLTAGNGGFICTFEGGVVKCADGALRPGGTSTIEIRLFAPDVPSDATNNYTNHAVIDPRNAIPEADETNNVSDVLTVVKIPATPGTHGTYNELTVKNTQTSPTGDVAPNGTLVYTLELKNHGSDPAFKVSVWDTVPAGSRFRAANSSPLSGGNGGFICTHDAGVVKCLDGTLAPGGTATIEIKLFAPDAPSDATNNYTNHAVVDPRNAIPEADETNNVSDVLTVVKVGGGNVYNDFTIATDQAIPTSGGAVAPSGTLIYRVTVANTGSDLAQNIVVRDYLPEGTVFRSAKENATLSSDGGGGFACFHDDNVGVVECRNGTLLSAEQAVIEITLFAPTQPGAINNQASVDPDNSIPEGSEQNNTAVSSDTTVDLSGSSDFIELDITELSGSPDPVATDTPVHYRLRVANTGSDQAFNVVVEDYLAPGMTFISAEDKAPGPAAFTCSEVEGTVTCTGGSIPAGGDRTVEIIARSPSHSAVNMVNNKTEIENQALVDPNNAISEGDETNNSAFTRTVVHAMVDLTVTNTAGSISSGTEGDWNFSVTNAGPDDVTNVVVTTSLPVGVIPLNVEVVDEPEHWSCQIEENPINQVTCTGTKIASGTTINFKVWVYTTAEGEEIHSTTVVDPNRAIVESEENNNTAQGSASV